MFVFELLQPLNQKTIRKPRNSPAQITKSRRPKQEHANNNSGPPTTEKLNDVLKHRAVLVRAARSSYVG